MSSVVVTLDVQRAVVFLKCHCVFLIAGWCFIKNLSFKARSGSDCPGRSGKKPRCLHIMFVCQVKTRLITLSLVS